FNVVLPTMLAHASPEVRQRFIPPMLRGEEIWCQFLSEPSGGSDLAGLLTTATRDGDTWVINGQKVWTTGANHSDYAVCLARTDPEVPKHAGLTMFAVPVRGHGVTVVPLQLLDGSVDFCQEYLDDVVIPAEHTIGAVNDGWRVATTLMTNERAAVGRGWMLSTAGRPTRATSTPAIQLSHELVQLATAQGRMQDPDVRALIGQSWVIATVQAQTVQRVADAMRAGKLPGHAAAIPKLLSGVAAMLQGDLAVAVAGAAAAAWPITDESGSQAGMARVASHGIGGGTNEMQRNAIAERLLGLPREPSTDRQVPFNQLRQNTTPASSAEASKS
ncbi:MAG TPA: acyl-CoA dehydrogenase family protein, partial [Acidimicrobiales bacterium]|nr:acyl-CoA dehydrogenase family protein [Acidimicrobiales bacterium]